MRALPTITRTALSLATLLVSFSLTLWMLDGAPAPPAKVAPEAIVSQRISSHGELRRLAPSLGLSFAPQIRGNVDVLQRVNDREVLAEGWLADTEGYGEPLKLYVFASGAMVARAETRGERPDVSKALGLFMGAEKNTKFQVNLECRAGDQLVIFALATRSQYLPLPSATCP